MKKENGERGWGLGGEKIFLRNRGGTGRDGSTVRSWR